MISFRNLYHKPFQAYKNPQAITISMRIIQLFSMVIWIFLASNIAWAQRAVLLFSLDGVGFEQLTRIDPQFIADEKVTQILATNPSLTFPGHATIATGVEPNEHGILHNSDSQNFQNHNSPDRLQVEPFWITAEQMGIKVDVYHWPNSYGPWRGIDWGPWKADGDAKFRQLKFIKSEGRVETVFEVALKQLGNWDLKKNYFFIGYTLGLDPEGHRYGPYDDKVKQRWQEIRESISNFKSNIPQKLRSKVVLVFVSDHGMREVLVPSVKGSETEYSTSPSDESKSKEIVLTVRGRHGEDPKRYPELNAVFWWSSAARPHSPEEAEIVLPKNRPAHLKDVKDALFLILNGIH